MSGQDPLWRTEPPSIEDARAARDEAMERVESNADAEWRVLADQYLYRRIRTGLPFTTDDLWDDGLPKPREPRALGPVMMAAKRRGDIYDTGDMVRSRYRHATKITVWRRTP